MWVDEAKTAMNAWVKQEARENLRRQTIEEKIEAIERMQELSRIAKASMQRFLDETK